MYEPSGASHAEVRTYKYCKPCKAEVLLSYSGSCAQCNATSGYLVTDYQQGTFSETEWNASFAITEAHQRPREVLRTVGKCIYCFTTDAHLDTEHIVPRGLGGRWELAAASCRRCAAITSKFERHFLQEVLLGPRAALRLPIQSKNRHEKLPFTYIKDGREETVLLETHNYPALALFPVFAPPAYLDGRTYSKGIDVIRTELVQLGGPSIKAVLQRYGARPLDTR
jgi:hypothetical protein